MGVIDNAQQQLQIWLNSYSSNKPTVELNNDETVDYNNNSNNNNNYMTIFIVLSSTTKLLR